MQGSKTFITFAADKRQRCDYMLETKNKLRIEEGKKYVCYNIEYLDLFGKKEILGFTVGNVYTSHKDGYLRNDQNIEMTFFHDAAKFFKEK